MVSPGLPTRVVAGSTGAQDKERLTLLRTNRGTPLRLNKKTVASHYDTPQVLDELAQQQVCLRFWQLRRTNKATTPANKMKHIHEVVPLFLDTHPALKHQAGL